MFQSQDGLVQFVFANEDTYFTDSGLKLSLNRWLFRELRERYKYVFFSRQLQKEYGIQMFDPESWLALSEQTKKLPFSIKGSAPYVPARNGVSMTVSADTILKLIRNVSLAACVFQISAFRSILKGNEALLSQLQQENLQTQKLLLVRSGVIAEYNRPFFLEADSVLHGKNDSGYLFPEVVDAFLEPDEYGEGCYRKLKNLMGDKCIFLNRFSREAVSNVVWNAAWHNDSVIDDISENELNVITDFVYMWYHSDVVQARWRGLFSLNDRREFRRLFQDLMQSWEAVSRSAEEYHDWVETQDGVVEDIGESYCIHESPLSQRLKGIPMQGMPGAGEKGKDREISIQIELQKACRLLQTERTALPGEELQKLLDRVIVRIGKSVQGRDLRTIRYGSECLQYACEQNFRMEGRQKACIKGYELLTEISQTLFAAEAGAKLSEQNFSRFKAELSAQMGELKSGSLGPESLLFKEMVGRAENLHEKVKIAKGKAESESDRVSTLNQMLIKLEAMIREIAKIKEFGSGSAQTIRDLSAELKNPVQQLRDLLDMNL